MRVLIILHIRLLKADAWMQDKSTENSLPKVLAGGKAKQNRGKKKPTTPWELILIVCSF